MQSVHTNTIPSNFDLYPSLYRAYLNGRLVPTNKKQARRPRKQKHSVPDLSLYPQIHRRLTNEKTCRKKEKRRGHSKSGSLTLAK